MGPTVYLSSIRWIEPTVFPQFSQTGCPEFNPQLQEKLDDEG